MQDAMLILTLKKTGSRRLNCLILSKSIPEVTGTDRILRSRAMQNVSNFEFDDQDNTNVTRAPQALLQ